MFETKVVEKLDMHILYSKLFFFFKPCHIWDDVEKCCRAGQPQIIYGACTLLTGYLRQHMHTQVVYYSFLFHCNNGCTNMPQCYVIHTLPVLFLLICRLLIFLWILILWRSLLFVSWGTWRSIVVDLSSVPWNRWGLSTWGMSLPAS